MKRYRVLLMVHETLVPPDDTSKLSESEIKEFRTEYDALSALRNLGHDVRVIGIGDRLTDETWQAMSPRPDQPAWTGSFIVE